MPRTAVTPQRVTTAGLAVAFEPANVDGNSFAAARGRALHVRNRSTASITVTLPTAATVDGLAIADRAVTVAAGAHASISVGSHAGIYGQTDGSVWVDYSAVTTVDVAVIDHP
jgi:hypothetical protein